VKGRQRSKQCCQCQFKLAQPLPPTSAPCHSQRTQQHSS
jgi:hypothetical protein